MAESKLLKGLSGRISNLVFRTYGDKTYTSMSPSKVKNPRTPSQMGNRMMIRNIINFYSRTKGILCDNFEFKTGHQSDYTQFLAANMMRNHIYLNKCEASSGYSIVAPYCISVGNLEPLHLNLEDGWLVSDIFMGNFCLSDECSVREMASTIIKNNTLWSYGDQIQLISCRQESMQSIVSNNVLLTLDRHDESRLATVLSGIEIKITEEGFLAMRCNGTGGYCIVHKRPSRGGIKVSTQQLLTNNPLCETYSSEEKKQEAVESYCKK